jgi:hypothetical protein
MPNEKSVDKRLEDFNWIWVVKDLRNIGKMNLLEAKLCMDYVRDNFIPKSALEEKQEVCSCVHNPVSYFNSCKIVNGIQICNYCHKPIQIPQPRKKIDPFPTLFGSRKDFENNVQETLNKIIDVINSWEE